MRNPRLVTVRFTRTFVSGNLAGMTLADELHFPDIASAKLWIDGVKGHAEIKGARIAG